MAKNDVRRYKLPILATLIFLSSCNKNLKKGGTYSTNISSECRDTRCLELVEKAEYYNAQVTNGVKEGPLGMKIKVEYVDSVYRMVQTIDENQTPAERVKSTYGNIKSYVLASISSAKGRERDDYNLMVDYRVSYEHIIKSMNTGDTLVHANITPDEIAKALNRKTTRLDELKLRINTIQDMLPRELELGYTMTGILYRDSSVVIDIVVDEKMKEFDEATMIKQWAKIDQAVTLADLTTGLTFHHVASKVPVGIVYYLKGSKGKNGIVIRFASEEVVRYDRVMKKIISQQ